MHNLTVSAVRHAEVVQVTLHGNLPDNCWRAEIAGTYPGTVEHIVDPGHAEVFVSSWLMPGEVYCLATLVPWTATVNFRDPDHDKVMVLVNNEDVVSADILDAPKQYSVHGISGTVSNFACSVVPEGSLSPFPRLYGPGSQAACVLWIRANCGA